MSTTPQPKFIRTPLETNDGIPVFSQADRYIENYEKIAADHVAAMTPNNDNPFIEQDLWHTLEESTRAVIAQHIPPGSRVLDAGVGMGRILAPMTQYERYGIDITFDYLKRARENGFNVAFSRIEDMPYEDMAFDAVVACDVLEHVIDLQKCCTELIRVLKPGGTLIVRVPFLDDMEAYLNEELPYEFIHVRSFDVATLRILFGKIHGLQYIGHDFVAPYFKDTLFKVKLLPLNSRIAQVAKEADGPDHPLWTLRKVAEVSQDEFKNWLATLKTEKPVLYRELAPELLEGLEVNIAFRKPV
ncbi:methionine biosynthesis protein MetW-like protein [Bordetella bronchiseptica 99-R-0433]|uniref:class I SAM-dependent methyltransferase n=1 Tax=Bordetella bronchiseptica TaxID=518 RepID=UPI00045B5135|nr:class I SAM-dependent methyltransferase [Bordetella bronchiseptica]KCV61255.1 methionine biosynthesis protein MetW-like protein [Bordetella bronchiseptica 99-R-0433]